MEGSARPPGWARIETLSVGFVCDFKLCGQRPAPGLGED